MMRQHEFSHSMPSVCVRCGAPDSPIAGRCPGAPCEDMNKPDAKDEHPIANLLRAQKQQPRGAKGPGQVDIDAIARVELPADALRNFNKLHYGDCHDSCLCKPAPVVTRRFCACGQEEPWKTEHPGDVTPTTISGAKP